MTKFKRCLSAFLALTMVLGMFSGISGVFVPKASAAGTSNVATYDEIDAQYDKFIYVGIDVIEVANGELTDGYVQPGDWLEYRMTILTDMYMGAAKPYLVYERDFFDVRVISSTNAKEGDSYTNNDYETNTKCESGKLMNAAHPYSSANVPVYHNLTSMPASKAATVMGYCEIDSTTYSNWDLVFSSIATKTSEWNSNYPMSEDAWYINWYARVKDGLADGETGSSFSPEAIWQHNLNPNTGKGDGRRLATISTADTQGTSGSSVVLANRYNVVQAVLLDDTYHTFTIGEAPSTEPEGPSEPSGPVAGTTNVATYAEIDAQYDKFIYVGIDVIEVANGLLTDGYVNAGDWLEYRMTILTDMYMGAAKPYLVYERDFFDVRVISSTNAKEGDSYTNNDYETNTKCESGKLMNADHPYSSANVPVYHNLTSMPASKAATVMGYCEIDSTTYSNWDLVFSSIATKTSEWNNNYPMSEDAWYINWYARVKDGLADGETGSSFSPEAIWQHNLNPNTGKGDGRRLATISTADTQGTSGSSVVLANRYNVVQAVLLDDTYHTFTIGENPAAGGGSEGPSEPSGPVAGTTHVATYAEIDAQYDKFIYVGIDVIEVANGLLTDGYINAGDWLEYRMTILTDMYMGAAKPYMVYERDFFDVRVISSTNAKEGDSYTNSDYETNTKCESGKLMNADHPYSSANIPVYHNLTSMPASKAATVMGYCEIDSTTYSNWDLVFSSIATKTSEYNYNYPMADDAWYINWYVRVKDGLADGETGSSFSPEAIWQHNINPNTGKGDGRRLATISTADTLGTSGSSVVLANRYNVVQAVLLDDTYHTFTIGEAPAAGSEFTATFTVDGEAYGEAVKGAAGTSIAAPADPEKDGYNFIGWAIEGTEDILTFPQTMGNANVTYVAIFEEIAKYTATFMVDGAVYGDVLSYEAGEAIVAPADPEKAGYTFTGWSPAVGTMGTEDAVFTANFTANTYNVEFYTEVGGTTLHTTSTVKFNDAYKAVNAPKKTGHVFAGWVDANGNAMPATHTIAGTAKFYATWTKGTFDAIFMVDGVVYDTVPTVFGEAIVAPAAPSKAGHEFAGWTPAVGTMDAEGKTFTAQWTANAVVVKYMDGATEVYAPTDARYGDKINAPAVPTKVGYDFAGWTYENGTAVTWPITLTESVTVYANWTGKTFLIDFYGETTDDYITTTEQVCGEALVAPDAPAKKGYTFTGWVDADGNAMPATVPASNATYFATYEPIIYTATFDANGGTFVNGNGIVEGIYKSTLTAPEVAYEGYDFAGWTPAVPATMPAENTTYTAQWTAHIFNVYYYVNGELVHTEPVAFGATIPAYTYIPEDAGISFAGWGANDPAGTTMPANDIKVYANTGLNTYNVTFNVNGEEYAVVPFAYGEAVVAPEYEVADGWTFSGWDVPATMPAQNITLDASYTANTYYAYFYLSYEDLDAGNFWKKIPVLCGDEIEFPEDPEIDGYYFDMWDNDATVMGAEDLEFVAMTTAIEYLVEVYDENGDCINDWIAYWGDEITEDLLDEMSKEGYDFAGWYADEDLTVKHTFPVIVNADVAFYAKFIVQGYKVFYIVDGAEYDYDAYEFGAEVALRADLAKEGYTFSGWMNEDGEPAVLPETMPAEDIYVYATYTVNQYTITFDVAGGSAVDAITQDYATEIVAPAAPTKEGYTFAGWTPAIPATMPAEDITVTANWTINQYTITFDVDGGTAVAPITQDYATEIVAPAAPTKVGYTFAGWDIDVPATMPAEDLVITAQWTINQYTITFDVAGGSTIDAITQDYATEVTAPADPIKEGYTFVGWTPAVPATMPANDVTVTAQWKINQYTITFNTDGGNAIAPIKQNYNTAVTAPAAPVKTGYTFAGWSPEVPATMPAGDLTVTAQWTINQYTITFDTVGGSAIDAITQDYATDVAAPADPVKEGYTFTGWDKDIPATMPAENVTITATWKVNYYTATFVVDGKTTTVETAYGEIPVAPEATKVGYAFTGWDVELAPMGINGATYVAQFEALTYVAEFNAAGGTWADGDAVKYVDVVFDTAITAPAEAPTRPGYIFAGWDKEIGNMTTEGIVFTAQWTNDLSVCRIQNVTRVTENVYGPQLAAYEIEVLGSPIKVQILMKEFQNTYWTFDRGPDKNPGYVEITEAGLAGIKAYNEAGEEVARGSADTYKEVWTVVAILTPADYKVRAKLDYDSTSWENVDYAYDYTMAYDEKPADPAAAEKIKSVTAASATVLRGATMTVTVVTDINVNRLKMIGNDGTTVSYAPTSSVVTVTEDAAAGTKTWALDIRFTYAGTADSLEQTWTFACRGTGDTAWTETDKAFTVLITRYEIKESPAPEYAAFSVVSVSTDGAAVRGKEEALTIVTTSDVTRIRLNIDGKTASYLETSNNVTVVKDEATGLTTWTINYRFGTVGTSTVGVQCRGNSWSAITDATTMTVEVAKA